MSFQQGLSGLASASNNLDVVGNNVANADTVGFKESQAQFADVYATSLSGSGAVQIGIGTKLSTVEQQFSQGNITASNNPLDIAINGQGFFRLNSNGAISYSRNGQFQLDKNGFIVSSSGLQLTGFTANAAGVLSTGAPAAIQINTADLPPVSTANLGFTLNLNANEAIPAVTPFDPANSKTYNDSTSATIYDSLGDSHVLQTFYVKTGPVPPATTGGTWDVYGTLDGTNIGAPTALGTLTFLNTGVLDTTATTLPFALSLPVTTGATSPLLVNLTYTGSTQYGSTFGTTAINQDGYASGHLSGFSAGPDGTITGRYTNGKSATLGQIVLANFADPNGLQSLGNNQWQETSSSGAPLVGTPGSGSLGVMQSSAVETSNVDLTNQLVDMITAQRDYQANAQTIKTQDAIMQTLVNLR